MPTPRIFPYISTLILFPGIMAIFPHITYAQSIPVAGYSPGARSATTANTMLDSVVGNSYSPVKKQTAATGDLYHISSDGTITAPNGLLISTGLGQASNQARLSSSQHAAPVHSQYRFGLTRRGKGFETVIIGVSEQPTLTTSVHDAPTARCATLNASFAPSNIYVIPGGCAHTGKSDRALTLDAATELANADGNIFTLAGNRSAEHYITDAHFLPNGDVELTSTSSHPSNMPASP